MPDSKNTESLSQLIIEAYAVIVIIVPYACRKYNHGAPPDEVEDLSQQIMLLLLENDCHRLKTYDPTKAKLKTWLQPVIYHEVSHHYQKQHPAEQIEALLDDLFSFAPSQEKGVLSKEHQALLREAIGHLTPHDQRITYLKLSEATDKEIAQAMNVKLRSLQQEWARIGKRLKAVIEKMGGGQKLCHIERKRKIFLLRRQHFCLTKL